jgi:hypothetical protein
MNPRMNGFERDTLLAVWNSKRVWLSHVIANALLLLAFFYWTQIKDENAAQFALTVIGGLLIGFFTLWLHAATFDYFHSYYQPSLLTSACFKKSLRRTAAKVPAFLLWAVIFGAILWLIGQLWTYDAQIGGWARHGLPEFLRRYFSPRSLISAVFGLVWFVFYFFWPIVFLPVGGGVAVNNFRGFFHRAANRPLRELRFWITYAACFLIGAYIPDKLAWMTPDKPSPLTHQQWSAVFRFGLGYLLLVTAWLILCAAIIRAIGPEPAAQPLAEPMPQPLIL